MARRSASLGIVAMGVGVVGLGVGDVLRPEDVVEVDRREDALHAASSAIARACSSPTDAKNAGTIVDDRVHRRRRPPRGRRGPVLHGAERPGEDGQRARATCRVGVGLGSVVVGGTLLMRRTRALARRARARRRSTLAAALRSSRATRSSASRTCGCARTPATTDVIDEERRHRRDRRRSTAGRDRGPNILEVALGLQHTCARKPDGTVKCWGDDDSAGRAASALPATEASSRRRSAVDVTDAVRHRRRTVPLVHRAHVRQGLVLGRQPDGQLGNGQSERSLSRDAGRRGGDHRRGRHRVRRELLVRAALAAAASRAGATGSAGSSAPARSRSNPRLPPVAMLTNAIAISAGESHACAVKADGKVVVLGRRRQRAARHRRPARAHDADGHRVARRDEHRRRGGSARPARATKTARVFCWGANEVGQLGSGAANPTPNPSPTVVSGLDAIALWAGSIHACAVRSEAARSRAGARASRDSSATVSRARRRRRPRLRRPRSRGISNAIGVGTGGNHSCAPTVTGAILCWGENVHGELGKGTAGGQLLSPESVLTYP